jgi:hypothetical protein
MRKKGYFVLVALVLAGCGSAAEPQTLPTPTPISSPPAEAAAPVETPSMATPDMFMSRYFELAEESLTSRAALRERQATYLPSCDACQDGVQVARSILDQGLEVRGGSINWTAELVDSARDSAVVQVERSIDALQLIGGDGEVVQSAPASPQVTEVYQLVRDDEGEWQVASIDRLP